MWQIIVIVTTCSVSCFKGMLVLFKKDEAVCFHLFHFSLVTFKNSKGILYCKLLLVQTLLEIGN